MAWKFNAACCCQYTNCNDDVLDKKLCIGKKSIKALLVASQEDGLEMNVEKTKCMYIS